MNFKQKLLITTSMAFTLASVFLMLTVKALGLNAEGDTTGTSSGGIGPEAGKFLGAGLAVGLAGLGSSIGMGSASAAAIGAISEDKEMFGSALIFVVLIEAVAIYGLLIALLLIFVG
ncbi:MAG: V-type ATP synthase subunit K [Candidatus Heimdallarchaeota archaeon]|nr:V-type ATP synthase subunit K [Candidatus Heimdallarchaeota archaeon]